MDAIEECARYEYRNYQSQTEKRADDVGINLINGDNKWNGSVMIQKWQDDDDFYLYPYTYFAFDPYPYYTYIKIATAVLMILYWVLMALPGGDRTRSLTIPIGIPITIQLIIRAAMEILYLIFRDSYFDLILYLNSAYYFCTIYTSFSFVVNSFFLLLSQSFIAANRKMDMSALSIFLICLVNIALVALAILLTIFLYQDASLFYSILVMVGHGIMTVGPALCLVTVIAAPFVCCTGSSTTDTASFAVFYAKIRLFWGSLFVLIAALPLMLSMLFSALRIYECISWSMILFDYKYVTWYSDLETRRDRHVSSVAVEYRHASNFMPLLHEIFNLWYLFWAILLLTAFRRRLFCCESDKRKTKKISVPSTGYPINPVHHAVPPTHTYPSVNIQNTVHPSTAQQHPSTLFPGPSATAPNQHPSTLFPEPSSTVPIQHPSTVFPGPSSTVPNQHPSTLFPDRPTVPGQHPSTLFPERPTVPIQPTAPPMSASSVSHNSPVSNMSSMAQQTPTVSQPISLYPAIQPVMVFQAPPSPHLNQGYHVHNYPQNNQQQQSFMGQMVSPGGIQPGNGY